MTTDNIENHASAEGAELQSDETYLVTDGGQNEPLDDEEAGKIRRALNSVGESASAVGDKAKDNRALGALGTVLGGGITYSTALNGHEAIKNDLPANSDKAGDAFGEAAYHATKALQNSGEGAYDVANLVIDGGEIALPIAAGAGTAYLAVNTLVGSDEEEENYDDPL